VKNPAIALASAALVLTLAGTPGFAQKTVNGVYVPEGNTLAEVLQRKAANDAQVQAAQAQLDQNAANKAAHDQAQQEYEAQLARIDQQKADNAAAQDRAERDHAAAMEKWKADVAACQAGHRARCAASEAAPD
jgi:hypothetical protein